MDRYDNAFTLDFAYCKNCAFFYGQLKSPVSLKELLATQVEFWHDNGAEKNCPKRELVISYNRAMVERKA